jgi:phage terminase large subunit-like protein
MSGKMKMQKNPVLLWNFRNVKLKRDEINDNIKPIKKSPQQKIDGVIALLM